MAVPLVSPVALTRSRRSRDALQWMSRSLDIVVPGTIFGLLVLACFVAPALFHIPSPTLGTQGNLPPLSPGHLLGTDPLGDDLLSRSLFGGRLSLEVGFGSVTLGALAGGTLGVLAGYFGGVVDTAVMRLLDMLLSFPSLVLALAVASYLGANEQNVIFAIAFFTVPAYGRLVRATTLQLRGQPFVVAAELDARSRRSIIVRHILPNVIPQMLTFGLITVAVAMIIESALSFLGLGVPPPQPSWGSMIAAGQSYLGSEPWLTFVPAAFLFVAVLNLNLLGDALRTRLGHRR